MPSPPSASGATPSKSVVLVVGPTPPPYTGTEVMTQALLQSTLGLRTCLLHMNTSRQRPVDTKGRFDLLNICWGVRHVIGLAGLVRRQRPAVVILPFAQNRAASLRDGLFVFVASAGGAKVVAIFHNASFGGFYGGCGPLWRLYLRLALAKVDRAIVLARSLMGQFGELLPEDRVRVCYNGIDVRPFVAAVGRPAGGRPAGDVEFLFVGHLSHAKGALDTLRAFGAAARQATDLRLTMIGAPIAVERNVQLSTSANGNWAAALAEVQHDHPGRIEVPGVVTGDAKMQLFAQADVFVLPSYSEAFPVSILEAMAAGLPIITTPVGAIPEVLQDGVNAIFVEPGDGRALQAAMLRLGTDGDLRLRMGRANSARVREGYTHLHFEHRMLELVEELLVQ